MSLGRGALTNRYLDFWLLGGASLVLWAMMSLGQPLRHESWAIDHHFLNVMALSASLALLVNYPHFMASYKMAYGRGQEFILRFWFQLILVPLLMILVFAYTYFQFDVSLDKNSVIPTVNHLFESIGLETRIGAAPNLSIEILGHMVLVMYFTVGWHYAKQVYGCMMVYSHFDKYSLSPRQRNLIKWNLFTIWWINFFQTYVKKGTQDFFGMKYSLLQLPKVLLPISTALFIISLIAICYFVIYKNYVSKKQLPSFNFLIPLVAFYVWWLPLFFQLDFFLYAVPMFHSLQYLPFVYKVESPQNSYFKGTFYILALLACGFFAFEYIPNSFDAYLNTNKALNTWFFFICTQIFINVHHYFIDNVLWRFDHSDIKNYLLS